MRTRQKRVATDTWKSTITHNIDYFLLYPLKPPFYCISGSLKGSVSHGAVSMMKHQLFYKMQNSLTPDYLSSLVPDNVGNNSAYNLRNARNLKNTIQAHSQLYYKSFLPSVTRDWKGLSEEIRNLPSLFSFKRHLDSSLTASPKLFFGGKRLGQIYHARLRMRCSFLNARLFSENIIDSPLCVCGSFEDAQHFLLSCTHYKFLRQQLVNRVTPLC